MTHRPLSYVMLVLSLFAGSAAAADFDLSKIDRTIRKEPVYQTKSPKYCLLLFGPQAETRVWLVFDGDTLYVDRNHNGDLTSPDKRFLMKKEKSDALPAYCVYQVGDLTEADGKTIHRQMQVTRHSSNKEGRPDHLFIRIKVKGAYYMATSIEMDSSMDRPAIAPIRHFHGPLSFLVTDYSRFFRNGEEDFVVGIGTYHGQGHPSSHASDVNAPLVMQAGSVWTGLQCDEAIPADIHPVAEIMFPPQKTGDPTIVVKVPLSHRC